MRVRMRFIVPFAALTASVVFAASSMTSGTCVEVVDGDTIVVEIEGQREVFDLAEIDAPELDQVFGEQSRQFLADLVLDKNLDLIVGETGAGDSRVARIRVGTTQVSREMLAAGMAWAGDSSSEEMILVGMMARGDQLGLWHDENPIPPALWRKRKPVPPTPVPVEVSRSLADAGRKLELRKNADGKAVISGLPMIKKDEGGDGEDKAEKPKDLKYEFLCSVDGVAECVNEKFVSKFSEAYEGDGPGTYVSNPMAPLEGQLTAVFQGTSALGRTFTVGAACSCDDDSCQCVMQFGKLENTEDPN